MGKRLAKPQPLAEIDLRRGELDRSLVLIPVRLMTRAGVTRGGWSVKDILGHLVEWQHMNLEWYAAGQRGETPALPAPAYTWRDLPRLNAMIYRKHHGRPLQAVLEDYKAYHASILALIQSLSEPDLVTLGCFSWAGPSWTLSEYLRASTAAHYLCASTRIRRWWRSLGKRNLPRSE